jgi:hypothetical protein
MPQSTCLHIQDRPSGPIRVVEIPWLTVRIGRAAYCEVRLDEAGLADEVCRLQRRGRTWHLVPFHARGVAVLVQDRPVEGNHPLPFDVPFRIGSCCLTLRQDLAAEPDWGMYQGPSRDEASGRRHDETPARPRRMDAAPSLAPAAEPSISRPEGPKAAPVNPWEARWKAAGARLPSTAARSPKVALGQPYHATERYPGVPPREPQANRPSPVDRPAPPPPSRGFSAEPRAAEAPGYPVPPRVSPPSRLESEVAARPSGFDRRAAYEPTPASPSSMPDQEPGIDWLSRSRPTTHLEPTISPLGRPTPVLAEVPEPQRDRLWPAAATATARVEEPAVTDLAARVEAWEFPIGPVDADPPQPECGETDEAGLSASLEPGAGCCLGYSPVVGHVAEMAPPAPDQASIVPTEPARRIESALHPVPDPDADEPVMQPARNPVWVVAPADRFTVDTSACGIGPFEEPAPRPMSRAASEEPPRHRPRQEHEGPTEAAPDASSTVRTATMLGQEAATRGRERDRRVPVDDRAWPVDPGPRSATKADSARGPSGFDLPSAREILASAPRRPVQPSKSKGHARTNWDRATPTLPREPGQWNAPLWLAWPPAALLTLAMGVGGLLLSCRWAAEAFDASIVAQHLAARAGVAGKPRPLPETLAPPEPSWWRTTPQHLAQWGVYLGRAGADEDRGEDARGLLEGAVRIAPVHPTARLARAELGPEADEPASLVRALGLSRDAASLSRTARSLRLAGKKAAAIRLYREALRIACRPDPATAPQPVFVAEPPAGGRYLLPGEAAAADVVRELFADPSRTFEEWSEAVPDETIARLATARIFREQGRPEADTLIAQVIDDRRVEGLEGPPRLAIRHAAAAEAHALLSRWGEAEAAYRRAIEAMDDAVVKRSWWFNLASIASRLDDEAQRQAALQAALDAPASDDISRRAMEFQRTSELVARPRSGAPKAN